MTNNPMEGSTADTHDAERIEFLAAHGQELRVAGSKLAEAASHVIREFDGLHRLSLAVAEWYTTLANEHGRGDRATPSPTEGTTR